MTTNQIEIKLQQQEWKMKPVYLEENEHLLSHTEYICRRELCVNHSSCYCSTIKLKHKNFNPNIGVKIHNTTFTDLKKAGKFITLFCKSYEVRK